jgi:hypothetical protein
MFRGVFDRLKEALALPEDQQRSGFESGERRILPSFFNLLIHLQAQVGAPRRRLAGRSRASVCLSPVPGPGTELCALLMCCIAHAHC